MSTWLWMTTLLSIALFVFLAVSGRNTSSKITYRVSAWFYFVGVLASILGLIGAIQLRGTGETFLFSLFGLPLHEGFHVTIVSSVFTLIVYALATAYSTIQLRLPTAFPSSDPHDEMLQLSWATLGLSLLILSPTLGQAFFGALICVLGSIWGLRDVSLYIRGYRRTYYSISSVALIIAFVLQTAATWVAWRGLHTVQLDHLHQEGAGQRLWGQLHGTVWIWFIGMLLQVAVSVFLRLWSGEEGRVPVQLRVAVVLALMSGLYVWLAWSVIVSVPWMITLVVVAGALEAGALVFIVSGNGRGKRPTDRGGRVGTRSEEIV